MKKTVKKALRPTSPTAIPGVVHANIQLPEHLHEAMKAIRQKRREVELSDVKLCKLYREAVEQYVAAKPQQRLLNGDQEALRNTA